MEIKKIIAWRNVWMGIAMLWVVWYHSGLTVENFNISLLKRWGYGGVDIFLFASGLGCYYSLEKNTDIVEFIKRRIHRIIPTYWLFLTIWIPYRYLTTGFSINAALGNILCIQTFTGIKDDFNWYISGMWLMYFLAPFFYAKIKKSGSVKGCIGLLALLILMTVPFWTSKVYIIMITRIPIFFMGMILGRLAKENVYLNKKCIFFLMVMLYVGLKILYYARMEMSEYLWSYGLHWYPFILIVPGLCVLISFIMEMITKASVGKGIDKVLSFVGKNSFDVYLVHLFLFDVYKNIFIPADAKYKTDSYWYMVLFMIIPCCFLFAGIRKGLFALRKPKQS